MNLLTILQVSDFNFNVEEMHGVPEIWVALGLAFIIPFFIAAYIYTSVAWQRIAQKFEDYEYDWLAWVPFARSAMVLHLGKIGWGWIFLVMIPVFGWIALWILLSISMWRIFENKGYYPWFALSYTFAPFLDNLGIGTILYFVVIGYVAWGKPNVLQSVPKED